MRNSKVYKKSFFTQTKQNYDKLARGPLPCQLSQASTQQKLAHMFLSTHHNFLCSFHSMPIAWTAFHSMIEKTLPIHSKSSVPFTGLLFHFAKIHFRQTYVQLFLKKMGKTYNYWINYVEELIIKFKSYLEEIVNNTSNANKTIIFKQAGS